MARFSYEEHPNYLVKEPKLLYIDRFGNIYPDCKTYKTPIICHITDDDALSRINAAVFGCEAGGIFNMVTIEVSSFCQADCIYCFQRDEHRRDAYAYYDRLMPLLRQLNTYWLFFSGGEILVQQDAMDFMRAYRASCPDTWIHLKTNGNADGQALEFVNDVCSSVMVSFNGFSQSSCRTIMGLDIRRTIHFCEALKEAGKVNLGLKLLQSPLTIAETPEFLDWALSLEAQCVAVQAAYNYEVEPSGKSTRLSCTLPLPGDSLYWRDAYAQIARRCGAVLDKHADTINRGRNYLTADREVLAVLPLKGEHTALFRTDGVYIIE